MRTTIKDVAREAGVSVTTVSHALNGYKDVNEATRKKIIEVANRLDYVPNANGRALGGKQQDIIAYLIAGRLKKTEPSGLIFGIMSGLYEMTQKMDYEFELLTAPEDVQEKLSFRQLCRKKNCKGIVVCGLSMSMPFYQEIKDSEIPCILIDISMEGANVAEVSVDNEQASREAVQHLFDQGYKHIALIAGSEDAQVSETRRRGYEKALQENNSTASDDWYRYCDFLREKACEEAKDLLTRYKEIDAFFCESDEMAIGVVDAIKECGLKPGDDIGVAGFDDIPISEFYGGGITSVSQRPYEIGVLCAETLVKMINHEDVPKWVKAKYTLEKRRTTQRQ